MVIVFFSFILMIPYTPKGRPNMIAWVAARMDAPNYGNTWVYRFPADTSVFGPAQIEARMAEVRGKFEKAGRKASREKIPW